MLRLLLENWDFDLQVTKATDEGRFRPDCVITIPGSRRLIIDSKAPIDSYFDALKATDEKQKEKALSEHLKKVKGHIDQLSKKDYSSRFKLNDQVVDGVILFIPIEGALSMALESDENLLQDAFDKKIILTFPTSLLAILKGMSMVIKQAETARDIEEIQKKAVVLYQRFSKFTDRFNDIGKNLRNLNVSFNESVGSYRMLMIQGKRFADIAKQNSDFDIPPEVDESVSEFKDQRSK